MNLVAKEAAIVGRGALVLSETAGAAEQLAADALMVTAADVAGTSEMLERGLDMPPTSARTRLRRLRASVREEDLAWWLTRQRGPQREGGMSGTLRLGTDASDTFDGNGRSGHPSRFR